MELYQLCSDFGNAHLEAGNPYKALTSWQAPAGGVHQHVPSEGSPGDKHNETPFNCASTQRTQTRERILIRSLIISTIDSGRIVPGAKKEAANYKISQTSATYLAPSPDLL